MVKYIIKLKKYLTSKFYINFLINFSKKIKFFNFKFFLTQCLLKIFNLEKLIGKVKKFNNIFFSNSFELIFQN